MPLNHLTCPVPILASSRKRLAKRQQLFVVGEDKRELLLHSDLVKIKSEALGEIIEVKQ